MKYVYALLLASVCFLAGQYNQSRLTREWQIKTKRLEFRLARFENYCRFSEAERVARLTGAPLFQVLTGKKAGCHE